MGECRTSNKGVRRRFGVFFIRYSARKPGPPSFMEGRMSNGDGCFDGGVRVVVEDFKILEAVVEQARRLAPNQELGLWIGLAGKLQISLFQVIQVQMAIAARPDELADLELALLRQHVRQQGVG